MLLTRNGWYAWLPWLAASVLALALAGFMSADLEQQQQHWQERIQLWVEGHQEAVDNHSRAMTQQARLLGQLITRDTELMTLVREAQRHFVAEQGLIQAPLTQQMRQQLYTGLEPYWQTMQAGGLPRLNLHFAPEAINFLRMDMPERAGDSIGNVRPFIAQVFHSGLPAWGVDVARSGSGPCAVLPIMANSDNTGAVIAVLEVGMAALSTSGDDAGRIHMAAFLQKAAVENLLWDNVRQLLHRANPMTVDDWRLERTGDLLLYDWWNKGKIAINRQGQLLIEDQSSIQEQPSIQDKPPMQARSEPQAYLASWIPVPQAGITGDASPLAVLAWHDISADYIKHRSTLRYIVAQWVAALVCGLLFLALYIRLQRGYLDKLLNENREHLEAKHQETEQARQRLALALRASESGFWEWDVINDTARFSPEWRELCGLDPEAPNSRDLDEWMNAVHPADKHTSYNDIVRHIKGETPRYQNEYRIKVRDGSYKWVLTRGKVVERLANGRAALMLGIYSDITERKNTELINTRQQAALHSLNEIASLSGIDPDIQLQRALSLGARYLGLASGAISRINGDTYRVRVAFSANNKRVLMTHGPQLADNYCSLVVVAGDVIAEDDIPSSHYRHHPAYALTKVKSYIGAPLWVDGEICGTLSFSSPKTRHHQYDKLDKDFVRLLARWISSVVERWQQDIDKKVIIERFHKLNERLPGFLFEYQMRADGSSFFPFASAGIQNIYNVAPADVVDSAECVFSIIHEDDIGWVSEAISLSASKLTPFVSTYRVKHPVRGLIWVHFESLPEPVADGGVLWHGYASDITALKETEQQLTQINTLRKAILDAANIAIISTDTQGFIKTFNLGAELMLGYSATEVIDCQTPALFHLEQENLMYAQQLSRELGFPVNTGFDSFIAKAREGSTDEREWLYVRKDGSHFPVLLTVTALRDDDEVITGYLGIARDISEIKRIDQMKTEFISTVSHELRTPLTAINGALGLVVNGVAGQVSEQALRMIHIAHNNSHRLIYLVNDLLDMEKLVAGKMYFDFHMESVRQIILQSIEENATYAEQYSVNYHLVGDEDVQVRVDKQRLLQVLANYLSNAAKFSPPHEIVSIHIEVTFGRVRVRVTDKGPGISEEFRPRLFQKFSQADSSDSRKKGGTGLGLAISKEIIERMGGTLGVEPDSGSGASFYFELPCDDSTPKVPASCIGPVKQKPHLLIVEDDQITAEILSLLVSAEHYDIDYAATGQAALELLQLRDYDLITLDLNLPDMTGVDIVRYAREIGLRQAVTGLPLPIMIISGDIAPAQEALAQAGLMADVYWQTKPLSFLEFDKQLTYVLAPADDQPCENPQ